MQDHHPIRLLLATAIILLSHRSLRAQDKGFDARVFARLNQAQLVFTGKVVKVHHGAVACLGEQSAINFFYYSSDYHDPLRTATMKKLTG